MNAEARRSQILQLLKEKDEYLNATKMAQSLNVSRQVIVSDIAILRERGNNILSTPRGYLLNDKPEWAYIGAVPCKHGIEAICEEFYVVVDNGGSVIDVAVEHPVYGQLSATLNIRSRYDADLFVQQVAESKFQPLSALTEGFHIHRIGVKNEDDFQRIYGKLKALGIVWEE